MAYNVWFVDGTFYVIFFCFQEKLAILSIVIPRSQVSLVRCSRQIVPVTVQKMTKTAHIFIQISLFWGLHWHKNVLFHSVLFLIVCFLYFWKKSVYNYEI